MRKADNLPPYCAVVKKSRSLNFLDPSGPAWPVTGVFTLLYLHVKELDYKWFDIIDARCNHEEILNVSNFAVPRK